MRRLSLVFLLGAAFAVGGLSYVQSQMTDRSMDRGAMEHGTMDPGG